MSACAISLLAILLTLSTVAPVLAGARSAEEVIAEVRRATARYLDVAKAREDGFVQISGMEPRHGYHFVNPGAQILSAAAGIATGELDLAHPPMLLYVERHGVWQLTGVEYALPVVPAANSLPGAEWHRHEASCHYRDWRELPAARARECPARHPASGSELVLWHPTFHVAHVWAWHPNPDGPFALENRYLDPYGGTPAPSGHRHRRNAAEVAYSELNHRVAGGFLLALAVLGAWTTRAGRRWVARSATAALWVLFGLYIFVTADPEAWPLGPKTLGEIFSDALVLQHKLLALLPMAIGVAEALRAAGVAAGPAWGAVPAALALGGGIALFYHDHEGAFRWDRIFFQHAAMGAAGVLAGFVLLSARWQRRWPRSVAWAWPALLLATSLVLLFYAE